MSVNLTRQELYDLVWSKPMMHAAKEFGISGVMLGRICRERHIPCPPRGYWAKLTAKKDGKRPTKISLPNLPEPEKNFNWQLKDEYRQREASRTDQFDPYDLNDPVRDPPPDFTESLEDFEKRIEGQFPKLVDPLKVTFRHPIVQKVYDADLILAAACKRKDYYYFDKPKYQDEKGQTELQMLNGVIHNFESLGFKVNLYGRKHFKFWASLLGHHREFRVYIQTDEPSYFHQRKPIKEKKPQKFKFSWVDSYDHRGRQKPSLGFERFNADSIKRIVMELVMEDEVNYRDNVVRSYQRAVESRKDAIREHERRIREEAAQKKRELEELLAKRINLMESAVNHMNQADRIRDLIKIMNSKANSHNKDIDGLEHWMGWAHHFADTIDPRHMSLDTFESWISKFKLKD